MSGSSSPATQTQTTSTQLSPQQQQLLGLAMPQLSQYAANPTTVPTSGLVAPFTSAQTSGQSQVLGANAAQSGITENAANASNFLTTGQALNPSSNPYEEQAINAAIQPIQQNLEFNTLPQLQEQATGVGQTGSSRAGVAQGLASLGASEAEGQTAANIANTSYGTGINAMTQALGLSPATAAAQAIPGATTSAVGDVQQQQQQQNIDAQLLASIYNSQQPLATGEALAGIASGIPGATTSTTGTTTAQSPSTLQQILGYGTLGTGLLGAGGTSGLGAQGATGLSNLIASLFGGGTASGASAAAMAPLALG
jgi:hypothetical protein